MDTQEQKLSMIVYRVLCIWYFNPILAYFIFYNFNCILVCTGLVGASRKSPCLVIIIIIIIIIIIEIIATDTLRFDISIAHRYIAIADITKHHYCECSLIYTSMLTQHRSYQDVTIISLIRAWLSRTYNFWQAVCLL